MKKNIDLETVKRVLDEQYNFLQSIYHVSEIGIFGSVARGQNVESSDIDILVEFSKPVGFFKFIQLEEYLSKVLGMKVDLVTRNALKPALKEDILKEVIYV